MNKVFDKNLLGIEDIEIGGHQVTQIRNGEPVVLDAINALYDAGLLKDLNRDAIPDGVRYLWFKGFYEEGDKGQGVYAYIEPGTYYYTPRKDNLGIYIESKGRLFEREGCWDYFGPTTIPVLRNEKRHWAMLEWFGARPNDSSYNCFWIFEELYKCTYVKCVEFDANQHYYFKQYTNIEFVRESSLEVRGNNAYLHFDVFAGIFSMQIPTLLDYLIMRDINYASIVPEFSFPANKCKYFSLYHNSNIHQPAGLGYLYKKDDSSIISTYSVRELPVISKTNLDDNALVSKEYVDKIYDIPKNIVPIEGDKEITAFKQLSIGIASETRDLAILDDDDIITEAEFRAWIATNIDALLPAKKFKLTQPPAGFEYLQFKTLHRKYKDARNNIIIVYINGTKPNKEPLLYWYDEAGFAQELTITPVGATFKATYIVYEGDISVTKTAFENCTFEEELADWLDIESPEVIYGEGVYWRLNKEVDDIRYWEKL